jgi:hypothetical protein
LHDISKFLAFRHDIRVLRFYSEGPTHLCETYAVHIAVNVEMLQIWF